MEEPRPSQNRVLSSRFELLRELGSGEFGTVYAAYDQSRHEKVAVKVLHRMGPDALYRFKAEFRALRDVAHPNLVHLGELFLADGTWFFTMELIEGSSFTQLVDASARRLGRRPDREAAELRLRDAFGQLARALSACHASQRVHCDVKPENVRIDPQGRVVLLDFGLVLSADGDGRFTRSASGGTLHYMAPEQAAGLPVGPAADFYSLGVMLHEALTGGLPFSAPAGARAPSETPLDPQIIAPYVPSDLSRLCLALLAHDPQRRPSPQQILALLPVNETPVELKGTELGASSSERSVFVGRTPEVLALDRAWGEVAEGKLALAYLEGDSGVGKTALAEHFVRRLRAKDPSVLVLRGRCYERETVPYKAFDGVFDQLADYLRHMPVEACLTLLPRRSALIRQMFPVLGRVPAVAEAPVSALPRDPRMLREQAFIAVRELLGRVAEQTPLVLWIEDLQWTDLDSLVFLENLIESLDPPACLLLITARGHADQPSAIVKRVRDMLGRGGGQRLSLQPLHEKDALKLAERLLEGDGDRTLAMQVAREAGGHPMFIEELAAHARAHAGSTLDHARLEDAIGARVRSLPEGVRKTLDFLAVAGSPLAHDLLASALQTSESDVERRLTVLRGLRLARTVTASASDCHHDRVRAAVMNERSEPERVFYARRLAIAMATADAEEDRIAELWCLANEPARAAGLWPVAAQRAAENLAFDRAAQLYARALEHAASLETDQTTALQLARADALVGAGQLGEAATIYLTTASLVEPSLARKLRTLAVQYLLQSGQTTEGLELAARVFGEVGLSLPTAHGAAVWAVIRHRSWLSLRGLDFRARGGDPLSAEVSARLDTLWAVAPSLVYVSIWQGAALTAQHLRLSLKAGDVGHITRGLSQEALFLSAVEPFPQSRTGELLGRATVLAAELGNPQISALTSIVRGNCYMGQGQFVEAIEAFEAGERLLQERCTHVAWELTTARTGALAARVLLGEMREHEQRSAVWTREARDRGDRYAQAMFASVGMSWYPHLLRDMPEHALRDLEAAVPDGRLSIVHALALMGQLTIGLYAQQADTYERLSPRIQLLRSQQLLRAALVDFSINMAAGTAAALRAKESQGSERRRWLRVVRNHSARTIHVAPELLCAVRDHLLAQAATLEGNLDKAVSLYRAVIQHHTRLVWVNRYPARFALGKLIGGDEGRAMVDDAILWSRSQGFSRPEAFLRCWSPVAD